MVNHDDVGRRVWANESLGQLVCVTRVPDGRGGHYDSAVVRFGDNNEQTFPAHRVVVAGGSAPGSIGRWANALEKTRNLLGGSAASVEKSLKRLRNTVEDK